MTNPFDSSPIKETAAGKADELENLSVRTLQDDVLSLQKDTDKIKFFATEKKDTDLAEKNPPQAAPVLSEPKIEPQKKQFDLPKETPIKINPTPVSPLPTPFINQDFAPLKTEKIVIEEEFKRNINSRGDAVYKTIFAIILLLSLAILGLGGYYFWTTKTLETSSQNSNVPAESTKKETKENTNEKYSAETPNYLSLDLTILTSEEIKEKILSAAKEINTANETVPYEFIVVDANNNPVTFHIFSLASELKLSPAILNSLEEDFSLFIVKSGNDTRMAVAVKIKEDRKDTLAAELLKQEKNLPADINFMFLETKPEKNMPAFNSSNYNNIPVRFINLGKETSLSIDYAFLDNQFVVGTSKDTFRAVLDKLSANN